MYHQPEATTIDVSEESTAKFNFVVPLLVRAVSIVVSDDDTDLRSASDPLMIISLQFAIVSYMIINMKAILALALCFLYEIQSVLFVLLFLIVTFP